MYTKHEGTHATEMLNLSGTQLVSSGKDARYTLCTSTEQKCTQLVLVDMSANIYVEQTHPTFL